MSGRRVRTLFPPCAAASHGRPAHLWRHHAPGQACRDGARRTWQRGAHHGRHKHMGALAFNRCMASAPPPAAPDSQHTTHTHARTQRRAAAWRTRASATSGATARAATQTSHLGQVDQPISSDTTTTEATATAAVTAAAVAAAAVGAAADARPQPRPPQAQPRQPRCQCTKQLRRPPQP